MNSLSSSIPSQNTSLWSPFMTTQSPRRSPNRRFHSTCRRTIKTGRVRNNAHSNYSRSHFQRTKLSLYYPSTLRGNYNWIYLPSTNRPESPHCLLLCKPHRISSSSYLNSNSLSIYRGPDPNNCPRLNIISPFLSSQHQL